MILFFFFVPFQGPTRGPAQRESNVHNVICVGILEVICLQSDRHLK